MVKDTRRKFISDSQSKKLAEPPQFEDIADERLHRKQRLAVAFRLLAMHGHTEGIAGHISVRDPEFSDRFWVNPFGKHFSSIRVSDLVLVDHDGHVLAGDNIVNGAAFAIHSRIHTAKQDIVAIAHAHTTHGKAWASLGRKLDPITQDACAFYQNHELFDHFTGVVIENQVGDQIAEKLGGNAALILQNHGLLTAARSVEAAVYLLLSLDRCCQVQLLAEAAGKPKIIDHATAIKTRDYIASDHSAWFSCQPLCELVLAEHPDVLE